MEWIGVGFFTPALIIMIIFLIGPFLAAMGFSLTSYRLLSAPKFIGFSNFVGVFTDDEFWNSFGITAIYVAVRVSILILISLFIAFVLVKKFIFRGVLQTMYILPFLFPLAATATIWKIIFRPLGLMEQFLSLFGAQPIPWLATGEYALVAILITTVWSGTGYFSIIMLAGVQTLPQDVIEAAVVDGASGPQRFVKIILPMLRPTLFYMLVIATIGSLQGFAPFLIMTKGGPGSSTRVLGLLIYEQGFVHMRMGYASTITVVVLCVIMAITFVQRRFLRHESEL
jgi:ABC-type sugar transport system permease subunit